MGEGGERANGGGSEVVAQREDSETVSEGDAREKKVEPSGGMKEGESDEMEVEREGEGVTPVRGSERESGSTPDAEKKAKPIHPFFSESQLFTVRKMVVFVWCFFSFSYTKAITE